MMVMPRNEDSRSSQDDQLASLFERHSSRVLSAAYRVTGSRQDSEDVLQTVFLRLAKRAGGVELDDRAGSYLHKAAVNASIDLLRARSRAGTIPLDDWPNEPVDVKGVSPESSHRDRELRRSVREALVDVPVRHARIFVLRFFEDMSNKEIASLLGVSQTAVGVSLFRTRKRLRNQLQAFVGGEA